MQSLQAFTTSNDWCKILTQVSGILRMCSSSWILSTIKDILANSTLLLYTYEQMLSFVTTTIHNKAQQRGGSYAPHPNSLRLMRSNAGLNTGKMDKSHMRSIFGHFSRSSPNHD